MASFSKRVSISSAGSRRSASPMTPFVVAPNPESEEWVRAWESVLAQDLIECPVVEVDAETTVEEACDLLLSQDASCLAVKASSGPSYVGLFDYADVNAFLTFAATRHTYTPEHLAEHPRVAQILDAAKAGHVSARLVSNLSEKNPLVELPHDASIIALLGIFSSGTHRVLIKSPPDAESRYLGIISDRRLLDYFSSFARPSSSFFRYISTPLSSLPLPSLNLHWEVVAVRSRETVLDAMRSMSELGVSSAAIVDEDTGSLLSAVSVTDVGKTVVPSQSNQILTMPLQQFVTQIKMPHGWTDGADKYPVYSVFPSSTLAYTIQKLLATNSHRMFVTSESGLSASPSPGIKGNLSGIVSIGDILSLFARVANLPDVDPTRMQRHRRASSSTSSQSSSSGSFADLVRSTSRGSIGHGRV
ncbi:hypothetical protein BV25DRAFT_1898733 [Artomyces pyxidatus]|uniref:Uncharacterized protein n=1 Tax=Artomyces pyxidatus TaxID=48021 RepID=A0ACB8T726_9AGAM|nr:hypothetical protein BV25DRAFT_1898733 [Artomyces pyxidatus]